MLAPSRFTIFCFKPEGVFHCLTVFSFSFLMNFNMTSAPYDCALCLYIGSNWCLSVVFIFVCVFLTRKGACNSSMSMDFTEDGACRDVLQYCCK